MIDEEVQAMSVFDGPRREVRGGVWFEMGRTSPPADCTYFQKPVTALKAHGGEIARPEGLPVPQL